MSCTKNETETKDIYQCSDNKIVYWRGKLKMVNTNYNDNDSHEKVIMIKNNYLSKVLLFQVYKNLFENNSLNYYSKRDPENYSGFFK